MKRSAGAPASICFASAELAAYETTILSPDAASYALAFASSASFRLAAANTVMVSARAGTSAATASSRRQASLASTRIFRISLVHRHEHVRGLDDRVRAAPGLQPQALRREFRNDRHDLGSTRQLDRHFGIDGAVLHLLDF